MAYHTRSLGLISIRQTIRLFETCSDSVKNFKALYFFITPINEEKHGKIREIGPRPSDEFTNFFRKFWSHNHFLTGKKSYVYKEDDISQEKVYLKRH